MFFSKVENVKKLAEGQTDTEPKIDRQLANVKTNIHMLISTKEQII